MTFLDMIMLAWPFSTAREHLISNDYLKMVVNSNNYGRIFIKKEVLLSYDENYVSKVDVEGMIGVKKKKVSIRENGRKLCL